MAEKSETDWQNFVVAQVVQALLGSITPRMKAISIHSAPSRDLVTVHFALKADTAEEREEIDVVAQDLDALFGGDMRVETDVWVGPEWWSSDWPGRSGRLVYSAKTD